MEFQGVGAAANFTTGAFMRGLVRETLSIKARDNAIEAVALDAIDGDVETAEVAQRSPAGIGLR